MCLAFVLAIFAPRLVFALMWIFGNRVDVAFSSWIWPLLLLIFLPWTGIVYTFMWTTNGLGVHGIEWLWVALAVAIDLMSWSARAAKNRMAY